MFKKIWKAYVESVTIVANANRDNNKLIWAM